METFKNNYSNRVVVFRGHRDFELEDAALVQSSVRPDRQLHLVQFHTPVLGCRGEGQLAGWQIAQILLKLLCL